MPLRESRNGKVAIDVERLGSKQSCCFRRLSRYRGFSRPGQRAGKRPRTTLPNAMGWRITSSACRLRFSTLRLRPSEAFGKIRDGWPIWLRITKLCAWET